MAAPDAVGGAFPGTNGRIAFTTYGGGGELYSMKADGTDVVNLTNNPAPDYNAMWSADGSKIAFDTSRDGNFEIYKMNADGSDQIRLTDDAISGPGDDWSPNWSPDGTKLVFYSDRNDQVPTKTFDIYTMNADGTNQTLVTNNAIQDLGVQWSPDGSRLVFSSGGTTAQADDPAREIYTMNPDGTSVSAPLTSNAFNDDIPSWSPDGTKIVFMSKRDGNNEIYSMNANGTNQVNLSNSSSSDHFPTWSPDGTKIVFLSMRDGNSEMYTMNPDGTNQTRLTNTPTINEDQPSWQPVLASTPPPPAPPPPAATPSPPSLSTALPSNAFQITRVRVNRRRGTATLTVRLPGPGQLALAGRGVRRARKAASRSGLATLPVVSTGSARRRLGRTRRAQVKVSVTYTPAGGLPRNVPKRITLRLR